MRVICGVWMLCALSAAHAEDGYRVFATDEVSGELIVIDPLLDRAIAWIPLGKRPRGLQPSQDGRWLYVALSGSPMGGPGVDERQLPPADKTADGIGVVDLRSLRLDRIIKGVSDPEQVAVCSDGKHLYVASEDTGTAVVLAVDDGRIIATARVGQEPEGVACSPDARSVFIASEASNTLSVLDTASNAVVATIDVCARPRAVAFDSENTRAFVTCENDASIAVIDAARRQLLRTVRLEGDNLRPMGIAVAPDDRTIYVTTGRGGLVIAVDAQTYVQRGAVRVGERPWGLSVSPDGSRLYTANGPSGDVAVIRSLPLEVITTVAAGRRPWGVAIAP